MTAKEKIVLVDPVGKQEGRDAQGRFCKGHSGNPEKLETALAGLGQWTLEIVKRSDQANGFQVPPRRWVVERTFAWFSRNRRLAKDFEATIASSQAWLYLASISLPPSSCWHADLPDQDHN